MRKIAYLPSIASTSLRYVALGCLAFALQLGLCATASADTASKKAAKTEAANAKTAQNDWKKAIELNDKAQASAEAGKLPAARTLWKQANAKYKNAYKLSASGDVAYNWCYSLDLQARAESNANNAAAAMDLWMQAEETCAASQLLDPDNLENVLLWGTVLGSEAEALAAQGKLPEAREYWSQAGQKFELMLGADASRSDAVYYWAYHLLTQANKEQKAGFAETSTALVNKAGELIANQVQKYPDIAGVMAYDWACVYSRQGNPAKAVEQLEIARQADQLPSAEHILTDPDLDPIRSTPEFQAWLKSALGS